MDAKVGQQQVRIELCTILPISLYYNLLLITLIIITIITILTIIINIRVQLRMDYKYLMISSPLYCVM